MTTAEDNNWNDVKARFKIGQEVEGRVTAKTPAGDLIDINAGFPILLPVSQMPEPPPGQSPGDLNPVGSAVKARIAFFEEEPDKLIRLTQKP
jgi:ribosomal protein S1